MKPLASTLLTLLSLPLLIGACARPKYLSQGESTAAVSKSSSTIQCGAKFTNQPFCVEFSWEKLPTESAPGSLIVKLVRPNLADQTAIPIDLDPTRSLQVELWMPSMGHASTPITVTQLDTGTFRASEVFFIMRGLWEIHFNVMTGETKTDSASADISF